jgi:hypothetical protein
VAGDPTADLDSLTRFVGVTPPIAQHCLGTFLCIAAFSNMLGACGGSPMSAFERLLVPGSTELPACRCGTEMQIASLDQISDRSDAIIRVYGCPACHHEMRLTVWAANTPPESITSRL